MDRDELLEGVDSAAQKARWTRGLLVVSALVSIGTIVCDVQLIQFLERVGAVGTVTLEEAQALDDRRLVMTVAGALTQLTCTVMWLMWIHRACANLHLAGSGQSRFTLRWSVGWHFVPFMNLVRVPQLMHDLVARSAVANERNRDQPPKSTLVTTWFALYVLMSIAGRAASSSLEDAQTIGESIRAYRGSIAEQIVTVAAATAAWLLARHIDRLQREVLVTARPVRTLAPLMA